MASRRIPPHEDKPRRTPLARRLTDGRKAMGYTQAALARRITDLLGREIQQGRICEFERGTRPSPEILDALKTILHLGTLPETI